MTTHLASSPMLMQFAPIDTSSATDVTVLDYNKRNCLFTFAPIDISYVTDAAELFLGSTQVCLSCNNAGSMSLASTACNDAHVSATQVSSGCCLQVCWVLSCSSSINFIQLI